MLETTMEKLIDLVEQKGQQKGEQKGPQKAIIRILKRRFGSTEADLQKQVQSISSLEHLDNLIDFSLTCKTLDEFKTKLIS